MALTSPASKMILPSLPMQRWFKRSPDAPPWSKSAHVFLKSGSTTYSESSFFEFMFSRLISTVAVGLRFFVAAGSTWSATMLSTRLEVNVINEDVPIHELSGVAVDRVHPRGVYLDAAVERAACLCEVDCVVLVLERVDVLSLDAAMLDHTWK